MNIKDILNNIQHNKKSQYWIFFSVLVFLTLFMMYCFGSSSSYSGYDFTFHYRRLYTLMDALKHGIYPSFYVDFDNVDGYGYFTKGFYSDIILVPFALIGLYTNIYFAYDVMIFTMTILCGLFMFHAISTIYKNSYAAALSAILYTFAVYRLYDIYQRGALAEALSFTFLPIVFLGLYYVISGDYRKWYVLAIGYSLLIYTHTIASVLMFVTLIILICIYYKSFLKEPKRILYLFIAGIVTVLLTAYYILPMLEQLYSNSFYLDSRSPGGGAGYGKVGFDYILWGFVSGIAYPQKELWTGIGIVLTLVIFLRFFVPKGKSQALKSVDIGVIIGICFIIATSRIFPWGRFPFSLVGFIQYPWRLYEFVSFFFAVAGGYYSSRVFIKYKQRSVVFAVLIVATIITTYIHSENYKSLDPNGGTFTEVRASLIEPTYENGYNLIGREYLPSKLTDISYIYERGEAFESRNIDTRITDLKRKYNTTLFNVSVNKSDTLSLPLLYYYGYTVTLDGEKLPIYQSDNGLLEIIVDKSGHIEALYGGTTLQKVAMYVSLISLLILCIYIVLNRKRIKNEAN